MRNKQTDNGSNFIRSFLPPIEDRGLRGRVVLLGLFAGLLSLYHLIDILRLEIRAINGGYFFVSYYTIKSIVFPIIIIYAVKGFLKLRFMSWVVVSFWLYTLLIGSLYRLRWVDFGNRFSDGGVPGEFAIQLESVLFSIAMYGIVQLLLNAKQIVNIFRIDRTYKRVPLIGAVGLFLCELIITKLTVGF